MITTNYSCRNFEGPRNLAIGLIRRAGYTKIAATIRKIKYATRLLLAILGPQTTHDQEQILCGSPCHHSG